jgi:hypothetical protein
MINNNFPSWTFLFNDNNHELLYKLNRLNEDGNLALFGSLDVYYNKDGSDPEILKYTLTRELGEAFVRNVDREPDMFLKSISDTDKDNEIELLNSMMALYKRIKKSMVVESPAWIF